MLLKLFSMSLRNSLFMLYALAILNLNAEEDIPSPLPETEIHLYDLNCNNEQCRLSNGKNISSNIGYDNQPFFTPENKSLLFSSMRDGKQIDIYEYFIASGRTIQITDTESMEYSPKISPDNKVITFVRDGEGVYPDQSVWQLNRKTKELSWAINSKEPVGYYHINHKNGDVLFWSRYGWSVQYLNTNYNERRFVSGNAIPSSPQQIPNSRLFSFVHRQTNSEVWIKSFDPITKSITPIAPIYGTNTDYTWSPNGDIFRVQDNILYRWVSDIGNKRWKIIQDMNDEFKGETSRLAISSDGKYIALVENL